MSGRERPAHAAICKRPKHGACKALTSDTPEVQLLLAALPGPDVSGADTLPDQQPSRLGRRAELVPVAQRIEHPPPKWVVPVRVRPGTPIGLVV